MFYLILILCHCFHTPLLFVAHFASAMRSYERDYAQHHESADESAPYFFLARKEARCHHY